MGVTAPPHHTVKDEYQYYSVYILYHSRHCCNWYRKQASIIELSDVRIVLVLND